MTIIHTDKPVVIGCGAFLAIQLVYLIISVIHGHYSIIYLHAFGVVVFTVLLSKVVNVAWSFDKDEKTVTIKRNKRKNIKTNRDLPEGGISQMGTLIVHRLSNDKDREMVERACGEIEKSASSFLPHLQAGEVALLEVDFPIRMAIQIRKPSITPFSDGGNFQQHWTPTPVDPLDLFETTAEDLL